MRCLTCNFDNPDSMKFCGECGAPLTRRCPACAFDNPPAFKFCGQCGARLATGVEPAPPAEPLPAPPAPPPTAERRQLTVMFCDLVDSTAMSERLDPEELREVIQAYQQTAAGFVSQYDGYIAQYLGDGILVYFGYPVAHEDDAQRAILTGLSLTGAIAQLNDRLRQSIKTPLQLQVRIGIHTGLVVVGEVGAGATREQLALGETTNIAARLQNLAQPDSVVISEATFRLVQGYFACREMGPSPLKGASRPVQVYRVLHRNQAHTRLDAAPAGLTPLVGREQEIALLQARWAQAREGNGQVVLLSGEAGLGKSRLVQVLKARIVDQPHTFLDCYCSPYHQNTALYPFIELLQRLLRFGSQDSAADKLEKLEKALARLDFSLPESVPLFAAMLSLPLPEQRYPPLNLSPQRQKQNTLRALLAILLKLAEGYPVLVVIEDLHWIDPSTLEMLHTLVEQVSNTRVLALFTYRLVFNPPWPLRSYVSQLPLARLSQPQVEQMAHLVAGKKSLPPPLLSQVIAKTDGVPIFVEELTKMVLEQAGAVDLSGPLPALNIPVTLQDLLMARLDRLGEARETAQLAAVLGREFSYDLLRAIAAVDEARLQADLARLVSAELLVQRGLLPQATFTFKHALIQDAAYNSLLKSKRQEFHLAIAQILVAQFPTVVHTQPELLAQHYTAAHRTAEAVVYWQRAGAHAVAGSAGVEAVRHFKRALELLASLPETPETMQQRLELQTALGAPLLMTKGYASAEVAENYNQARELCRHLDETPRLLPVLFGLWVYYLVRAEYATALDLSDQILRLAQQLQQPDLLVEAFQVEGITHFYLGHPLKARQHLEEAVRLYESNALDGQISPFSGADRGVACLSHLALTLWLLGYPDQALARSRQAIELAERLSHPYSLAFALFLSGWLHQYRREANLAHTQTTAAVALSREQGFALLEAVSTIMGGWALTALGQSHNGIGQIFEGLKLYSLTGGELGRLHFLALLAEAHAGVGQVEEGLAVLEGALKVMQQRDERFYEAELYRLKGELLSLAELDGREDLVDGAPETFFKKAIQVARQQQARSLELRAAVSLGKLWQRQGRIGEAHRLLHESYPTFAEGHSTADLLEAHHLLQGRLPATGKAGGS